MIPLFNACGGRSTFFAFLLIALGTAMAIAHRLDANYVALVGVIQTLVTARAISDDHTPGVAK